MEVIVDYNTGTVAKVETITDGGDLAAAQAQKAAMAQSTRSLAEATATAVKSNAGYRAVSAFPNLAGGHPVAEVTLVRGDEWKVVTERLDLEPRRGGHTHEASCHVVGRGGGGDLRRRVRGEYDDEIRPRR